MTDANVTFSSNLPAEIVVLTSGEDVGSQWRTQEFCSGLGVQQIQLRTEDRENGHLGAVAS